MIFGRPFHQTHALYGNVNIQFLRLLSFPCIFLDIQPRRVLKATVVPVADQILEAVADGGL
jgi:hypothetical protein